MCLLDLYTELKQWLDEDTVPECLLCSTVPEISYWITLSRTHSLDVGANPWLITIASHYLDSRIVIVHSELRRQPVILHKNDWNRAHRRTLEPCKVAFVDLRSDMFCDPNAKVPQGHWLEDHFERLRLTADRIEGWNVQRLYWSSIPSIEPYLQKICACADITPTVHVENTSEPQLQIEYRDNSEKASETTTLSVPATMEDSGDKFDVLQVEEESHAQDEMQDTDDNFVLINLHARKDVAGISVPP